MNDQTIEALGALLAKQRSEVARTGQLEFNSTIMEALSTRQIILCRYDPILSPMMVYQLVREQYQIMEVADDERSGDRVFRHRALSTFELATKNIHKDAILLNHASHNRHAYQTFEKVADYLDKPIINPQQLAYISRQSDKPIYSTIDPEYYVTSIVNN